MAHVIHTVKTEIPKFLSSGFLSFIVTFLVLNGLLRLSIPLFSASVFAYGCGMVSSFMLNKRWTFSGRKFTKTVRRLFVEFLLFNFLMMFLFGQMNLWFFAWMNQVFLAQMAAIAVTTVVNFLVYKFLIFKAHS